MIMRGGGRGSLEYLWVWYNPVQSHSDLVYASPEAFGQRYFEYIRKSMFYRSSQLRNGAILVSIAHAIHLAQSSMLSHEVSWDGPNYNRQDSQGTRGTVTFADYGLVGAFRDDNSPRCPWRGTEDYDSQYFLKGMPEHLRSLAQEEALQYLYDEYKNIHGPIITAAFWSQNDSITAAEPWSDVLDHGAHILHMEFMEAEAALLECTHQYGFPDGQTSLLWSLFNRRITSPTQRVTFNDDDLHILTMQGNEGLTESLELLGAIGIAMSNEPHL
jgi:hypothetical protein